MIVRYGKRGAILPGNMIEYAKNGLAVAARYEVKDTHSYFSWR